MDNNPEVEFQAFGPERQGTEAMYLRFRTHIGSWKEGTLFKGQQLLHTIVHEVMNLDGSMYSREMNGGKIIDFILAELSLHDPKERELLETVAATDPAGDNSQSLGSRIFGTYRANFYTDDRILAPKRREQLLTAQLRYPEESFMLLAHNFHTMLETHHIETTYADDAIAALSYWYDNNDVVDFRHQGDPNSTSNGPDAA